MLRHVALGASVSVWAEQLQKGRAQRRVERRWRRLVMSLTVLQQGLFGQGKSRGGGRGAGSSEPPPTQTPPPPPSRIPEPLKNLPREWKGVIVHAVAVLDSGTLLMFSEGMPFE